MDQALVLDGSIEPDARVLAETENRARILVRAKSDLSPHPAAASLGDAMAVSALTGDGLDALARRLAGEVARRAALLGDEGVVASLRADAALAGASTILGIEVGDAVLDRICATFCLGK